MTNLTSKCGRDLAGRLLAKFGLGHGSSGPSTRPTTPTSEEGNLEGHELGGESRSADAPPQQSSAPKNKRWRRARVVTKVLGLSQGQHSQYNAAAPSDDENIVADALSERHASAPLNMTSEQHMTGGIMQRFGPVDDVQYGPYLSPPSDSTSIRTAGSESWDAVVNNSAVNTGHIARNFSGQRHGSPNLEFILKFFGC